eukprot:3466652-Pyramimonas_sp.AAC.1
MFDGLHCKAANPGSVGLWKSAMLEAVADVSGNEVPHASVGMDPTAQHCPENVSPSNMDATAAAASLAGLVNALPPQWQGLVGTGAGLELLNAVRAVGNNSAAQDTQTGTSSYAFLRLLTLAYAFLSLLTLSYAFLRFDDKSAHLRKRSYPTFKANTSRFAVFADGIATFGPPSDPLRTLFGPPSDPLRTPFGPPSDPL